MYHVSAAPMRELPTRGGRAAPQTYKESPEQSDESESEEKNVTVKRSQPARRAAAPKAAQQVIESAYLLAVAKNVPFSCTLE